MKSTLRLAMIQIRRKPVLQTWSVKKLVGAIAKGDRDICVLRYEILAIEQSQKNLIKRLRRIIKADEIESFLLFRNPLGKVDPDDKQA